MHAQAFYFCADLPVDIVCVCGHFICFCHNRLHKIPGSARCGIADRYLTLGFYPGDRIGEVQISGFKHGSNVDLIMEDACALISALLQRFVSPLALQEMMARKPDGGPASLIGATVFRLVESVPESADANE